MLAVGCDWSIKLTLIGQKVLGFHLRDFCENPHRPIYEQCQFGCNWLKIKGTLLEE